MTPTGRQWLVIVNPASGTGRKTGVEDAIRTGLQRFGISARIVYTSRPGEATEIALRESENFEVIVAAGGDGTVRETATGLFGTKAALGILPLGSGNGLARHLGISHQLSGALAQLAHAAIQPADGYRINGRPGVNVGGLGFDGEIARLFNGSKKRGLFGYIQLIIKSFSAFSEFKIEVIAGEKSVPFPAFMVCAANGSQFGNNAFIARRAQIADGLLDVRIVRKPSWLQVPGLVLSLYLGRDHRLVTTYQVREFFLKASTPQPIHADGDFVEISDQLDIQVLPSALRLLVP